MHLVRLGALTLLMLCAPFCFSQPKLLIVEGSSPDFGDIYTPTTERFLTLKNIGTDTLTIANVSTTCGCTAALLSNDHIAPGESGTVSIKFDAKRFSGPVLKAISMDTNDKTQKHVNISFKANVIKSIDYDPEYFFFSTMVDSTSEKEITLQNASPQTIRIRSITPSSDFISIKLSKDELGPGEEATLTGTIHPFQAGTVRGSVEIITDFSPFPKLSIGYFAYTKPRKTKPN